MPVLRELEDDGTRDPWKNSARLGRRHEQVTEPCEHVARRGFSDEASGIEKERIVASQSACFAEREEASPWLPLHVRRGFAAQTSTVTVLATESAHNIHTRSGTTASESPIVWTS